MKTSQGKPGVRHDFRTDQYVPTIDGKDTSPTSFDKARALQIAEIDNERVSRLAAFKLLETVQKERDDARNHADKLAEALRESAEAMTHASTLSSDVQTYLRVTIKKARHALAAREAAQ